MRDLLGGSEEFVEADALVMCLTNVAEDTVALELSDLPSGAALGSDLRAVGDAVAPRTAVHAIYEGRVAGMTL